MQRPHWPPRPGHYSLVVTTNFYGSGKTHRATVGREQRSRSPYQPTVRSVGTEDDNICTDNKKIMKCWLWCVLLMSRKKNNCFFFLYTSSQIVFRYEHGEGPRGLVALDDISFSKQCVFDPEISPTTATPPSSTNTPLTTPTNPCRVNSNWNELFHKTTVFICWKCTIANVPRVWCCRKMSFSVGGRLEKCVFWKHYGVIIMQTAHRGRTRTAVVRAEFFLDLDQTVKTWSLKAFSFCSGVFISMLPDGRLGGVVTNSFSETEGDELMNHCKMQFCHIVR